MDATHTNSTDLDTLDDIGEQLFPDKKMDLDELIDDDDSSNSRQPSKKVRYESIVMKTIKELHKKSYSKEKNFQLRVEI